MSHHNTVLHQLLRPLSRHEFEELAQIHHAGQKLRSVSRWDQFVGLAMSQLAGRQSLRDIEANLRTQKHKLYHLGAKPISRSSLARVNEKQPHELYQHLFSTLLVRLQGRPVSHKFRFKNPLFSLDASLIDLSLKLFPWADCNRSKAAMKLHVGLNHSDMIPEFVALSDGKENDLVQGRQFDFPTGSIVAFDKGYNDYGWYNELNNKGVFFVTRLRPNAIYTPCERRAVNQKSGVTSDQIIQLNSVHALKRGAPQLRRVGYRDSQSGKHYVFLTNHFHLSARTIADIYKERWQVELFFKAIKQNLKLKTFVGTSKNAILTQIWVSMCIYLLVAYLKYMSKTTWSVQRLMRVLQVGIFDRRSILELIDPGPPPKEKSEPQMRFAL